MTTKPTLHHSIEKGKTYEAEEIAKVHDRPNPLSLLLFKLRAWSMNPYQLAKGILQTVDVPNTKEVDVLDVGCGPGEKIGLYHQILMILGAETVRYCGIDLSAGHLERARRKTASYDRDVLNCHFEQQNFLLMETSGRKYDYIFITAVWHHFEDDEQATHQIENLLKPGGIAIVFNGFYPEEGPIQSMALILQRLYRFVESRGNLAYRLVTVQQTSHALNNGHLSVEGQFLSPGLPALFNTRMIIAKKEIL